MPATAVLADGLQKRYRDTHALDGLDLAVPAGTVYGLLGPNGAGKTTAVRILCTLLRPDGGRAEVAGFDVSTQARLVRRRIGLTGQHTTVDDKITARQNLVMFGRLFHIGKAAARQRADELLDQFGLADHADKAPKQFSGGMRRRLDLATSMILAPAVLFLDEPTTGLDPAGRQEVWQSVGELAARGTTVLLTTHYLDEADRLCERIGVIDRGRNVVEDSPAGLKRRIGTERLEVVAARAEDLTEVTELLEKTADGRRSTVDRDALAASVSVPDGVPVLVQVAAELRARGIAVADLGLRRPTLDEAFLHLTGGRT
ncbi:daunorubicin resistance protein DrrA family ABC transporter ATP-binding protein [Virgisporangium ochraceum]|uniref:Daunorubicin resistance protein DrrA family ABC transporter ATP-binding protein n=1 Tax=Virgisporangium ochraceum TaxID=65505 RepID=A0A8J4EGI2_9ACTN|nr:ATP-binding cassette domain-containing protein [Virgisporangium ochraceum]GIJ71157.1 daunorubicin resistance protein DrrA family ABC transporter ATP-binding protein [Virgisporangium ochraceum]